MACLGVGLEREQLDPDGVVRGGLQILLEPLPVGVSGVFHNATAEVRRFTDIEPCLGVEEDIDAWLLWDPPRGAQDLCGGELQYLLPAADEAVGNFRAESAFLSQVQGGLAKSVPSYAGSQKPGLGVKDGAARGGAQDAIDAGGELVLDDSDRDINGVLVRRMI